MDCFFWLFPLGVTTADLVFPSYPVFSVFLCHTEYLQNLLLGLTLPGSSISSILPPRYSQSLLSASKPSRSNLPHFISETSNQGCSADASALNPICPCRPQRKTSPARSPSAPLPRLSARAAISTSPRKYGLHTDVHITRQLFHFKVLNLQMNTDQLMNLRWVPSAKIALMYMPGSIILDMHIHLKYETALAAVKFTRECSEGPVMTFQKA